MTSIAINVEDTKMWKMIRALPIKITRENILPLSYHTQHPNLLEDIRNFTETKKVISDIYLEVNAHLLPWEVDADKNWLVSDVLYYIQRHKYKHYNKQARKYNRFMSSNKSIHSQFNIFWGFLYPEDRNHFVRIRTPRPK